MLDCDEITLTFQWLDRASTEGQLHRLHPAIPTKKTLITIHSAVKAHPFISKYLKDNRPVDYTDLKHLIVACSGEEHFSQYFAQEIRHNSFALRKLANLNLLYYKVTFSSFGLDI